jgi:AraC-like DNA-binding protein
VAPDGYIEMNFNLQSPLVRKEQTGETSMQPDAYLVSRFSNYYYLKNADMVRMLGIRFYPWAIRRFVNCAANEITDKQVNLEDLFGSRIKLLYEQVANVADTRAAICIVEIFLLAELNRMGGDDTLVEHVSKRILLSDGLINMPELISGYTVSQRSLQQKFNQGIGVSPMSLKRIVKFQRALRTLNCQKDIAGNKTSLTDISYQVGYYDQSHFIHEFRHFAGISPKQYLKGDFQLTDIVNDLNNAMQQEDDSNQ